MFNIADLKNLSSGQSECVAKLAEFKEKVNAELRGRHQVLKQYENGELLLNRDALARIENLVIETQHLYRISTDIAAFWGAAVPAIQAWKTNEVMPMLLALNQSIANLSSIAGSADARLAITVRCGG